MSTIILPSRWNHQPGRVVDIDSGSQLASGITASFTQAGTGTLYDYVNRVFPSADTSTQRIFAPSTVGRDYSGTANTQFAAHNNYPFPSALTLFALIDVDELWNYSAIAACQSAATNGWEFRLGHSPGASNLLLHRGVAGGGFRQAHTGSNRIASGSRSVAVAVSVGPGPVETVPKFFVSGGGNAYFYGDATTYPDTGTGTADTTSGALYIGRRVDGVTQLDGGVHVLHLFRRALSENELRALAENPWQVFKKSARILYFPSAGGGATGTLAATESGSDTAALTGDVLIDGALAATESGSDTAALTGDVIVQGALAVTESGTDTAAATGLVLVQGALAATESGSDTAALAGLVLVQGSIASVEPGADTASIAGDVLVSGALAASETGSDTAAFTGDASLGIFGSIDAAESGSDSAQVTGLVLIQGGLAVTETGSDTAAITGPAAVSGSIAATETGSDTAAVTGLVLIYGSLATTETGSDTAAVSSFRPTVPGIEYTLPEGKAHYTLPDGRAHYTIAA